MIWPKYRLNNSNHVHIFVRCLRSVTVVTPVKYERDIKQVTSVLVMLKKWENNGTEKIGLVTPPQTTYTNDLVTVATFKQTGRHFRYFQTHLVEHVERFWFKFSLKFHL